MKPMHLIGLVLVAVAIGVILSTAGDASSYVTFAQAKQLAQSGSSNKIHVVGELQRNAQGKATGLQYNPKKDPNLFTFLLTDDKGHTEEVVYYNPKPQDFERSEKVVVVGAMHNNVFVADKILMKCPSKYQETEFKEVVKVQPLQSNL